MTLSVIFPLLDKDTPLWICVVDHDKNNVVMGGAYFHELPKEEKQKYLAYSVTNIHTMVFDSGIGIVLCPTD